MLHTSQDAGETKFVGHVASRQELHDMLPHAGAMSNSLIRRCITMEAIAKALVPAAATPLAVQHPLTSLQPGMMTAGPVLHANNVHHHLLHQRRKIGKGLGDHAGCPAIGQQSMRYGVHHSICKIALLPSGSHHLPEPDMLP